MRKVALEYGEETWEIEVPDDAIVIETVPEEQFCPPLEDPLAALHQALADPMGMDQIETFVDKDSRVSITVNDWMGGSFYAAPVVLDILRRQGVQDKNIRIMIAGGTHAQVTKEQLHVSNMGRWITKNEPPFPKPFCILPPEIIEQWCKPGNDRIERHDAADPEAMVNFGHTDAGDLLEVNRIVVDSDVIIHLGWGPVRLSPWGGFLGGGGAIVLGLSSARAILGHHGPEVINHPSGHHSDPNQQLFGQHKLQLMEKLEQSVSTKMFLIDPYFNVRGDFAGRWWAGHWRNLRESQFDFALKESTVDIERGADIVVLDCPPWMFHGATDNPLVAMLHVTSTLRGFLPPNPLLRKGGVVICVTPCDGTIDEQYRPSDREAIDLYARGGNDIGTLFDRHVLDFLNQPEYVHKYRHCYGHHPIHPFWLLAAAQYAFDQSTKIIFAGAKDSEPLRQMGITAVPDLKTAWEMAVAETGKPQPDVTVLPKCSKRSGLVFNAARN